MTQHTPGPWLIATSNSWRRIVSVRGDSVCEPCTQHDGHPDLWFRNGGHDGPDARLIAAAPELLQSCRGMLHALETDCRDTDKWAALMGEAVAAIAKATGSQT